MSRLISSSSGSLESCIVPYDTLDTPYSPDDEGWTGLVQEKQERRISLVNSSGGSCRCTDSLLGDSLCSPSMPLLGPVSPLASRMA